MKRTFSATVLGISHTDTSDFATGAHSVSLAIFAQAPLGQVPRRVNLPLFSVEEARELGALYRSKGAVWVTLQTSESCGGDKPNRFAEAHARILAMPEDRRHEAMRRSSRSFSVPDACVKHDGCRINGEDVVWPDGERWPVGGAPLGSEAVFSDKSEPPPIVNGKPSCCEPVKGSPVRIFDPRISEYGAPKTKAWALGAHFGIEHCPYCGAKLPALDGTPS